MGVPLPPRAEFSYIITMTWKARSSRHFWVTTFSLTSPGVRRPRRSSARPTQTGRRGEGVAEKNRRRMPNWKEGTGWLIHAEGSQLTATTPGKDLGVNETSG